MIDLTLLNTPEVPLEADCIRPDLFQNKSLEDIQNLEVLLGNRKGKLGDFFKVAGDPGDSHIRIHGDCTRVKWIGAGMTHGTVEVLGNTGMHVGSMMRGGELVVHGSATDWVGAEMRGGLIRIHGDAGHLVGAAYRGSSKGMRGGTILIQGKAGNEIGAGMRRGLIAIGKDAGDFVGSGMIAGTILVAGQMGIRAGAQMKRGTLICLSKPQLLPTFRRSCEYHPTFLNLYFRKLQQLGFPVSVSQKPWQRFCGDLVALGKGEILVQSS